MFVSIIWTLAFALLSCLILSVLLVFVSAFQVPKDE